MAGSRRQQGEGSVYQRGKQGGRSGQWVAVADLGYRAGKRDRREFTGPTPASAMAKREKFLDRKRDGFVMPKGREPHVDEWMLHWLHNIIKPKVRATTWHKSYRQKTEDLICPYFERVPLSEVDEELIESWHRHLEVTVSGRTGRPLSASTIGQAHRLLSMGLKVAVARKRIARNPASGVTPPPAEAPEPMPPEDDEVEAILAQCQDWRSGPRWITGIATGLRQGEALGMLWPLLDLAVADEASYSVQWELVRLPWEHGCADPHACGERFHRYRCPDPCPRIRPSGRPHACVRAGDDRCCPPGCDAHARRCPARRGGPRLQRPKTGRSRARIPVAPYAAAALRQWKTDQKAERLAWGEGWGGWEHDPQACAGRPRPRDLVCAACMLPARPGLLVWTQRSGLPVDPRRDWQDWSDLLEKAGVEHVGTHGPRHGLATALLEDGMDIRIVQEIMRHATPDFTRRAYQHVRQQVRRDAANAIDRRLRGAR